MIWRHQMIAEKYLGGVYKKKMTPPELPEKSYGPYKFKLVQLISQLLMNFWPLSQYWVIFYCVVIMVLAFSYGLQHAVHRHKTNCDTIKAQLALG